MNWMVKSAGRAPEVRSDVARQFAELASANPSEGEILSPVAALADRVLARFPGSSGAGFEAWVSTVYGTLPEPGDFYFAARVIDNWIG